MNSKAVKDYAAIRKVMGYYVEGGVQGKSEIMKKAFHPQATMYGHTDGNLSGGPIQNLYDLIDSNPPAKDLKAEITTIVIEEKIAHVRVEAENWNEARYSDMFLLVKDGDDWKILHKIYYSHM